MWETQEAERHCQAAVTQNQAEVASPLRQRAAFGWKMTGEHQVVALRDMQDESNNSPPNSELNSTAFRERDEIWFWVGWASVPDARRLSAGGGRVLSAHCCRGVCSCGCAPSLSPSHRTGTAPSPACLLGGPLLARVCVSLTWGRRSRGPALSPAPSLCPGLSLFWPESETGNETASASSCGRNLRCCCGARWTWSHYCCGGWFWTWGGTREVTADVAAETDCDCESENVSENCRSLSDCVCCCNCGNQRRRWWGRAARPQTALQETSCIVRVSLLSARRAGSGPRTCSWARSTSTPAVPPNLHVFP